jgi:peroxiredoxin
MLKKVYIFIAFIASVLVFIHCAGVSSKGTVVKGKITDASDLRVFLDKLPMITRKIDVIAQSELSGGGKFKIETENQLEPGIYRIRIGSRYVNLILDGSEKSIDISGSLSDIDNGKCVIKGSDESVKVNEMMGKLYNRQVGVAELNEAARNAANPLSSLFFALGNVSGTKSDVELLKGIVAKLRDKFPKSDYTSDLDQFTTQMEAQIYQAESTAAIKDGAEAPNIALPNPDGKVIELKSLRGKVVLLDFWASWCGPCRRENPNVVNVYNKYKDKGFTVYSVSLDRPGGMENWKAAIAADKLSWPNHVSDLQHWNSAAGRMYGIQSIPQTFLLDKEGRIVGENLRGPALEPAVKKLL